MSERILFLDVDGVLNHLACWTVHKMGPMPIDPECVTRLDRVCRTTGARVVLSSAWRDMPRLEARLEQVGALKHRRPTDWRTPHHDGDRYTCRGAEIAEWLSRHEIEHYAIVDDDSDMLPEQQPFFVKTDFHNGGLTTPVADRLIEILVGD